jgi:hypothetical protein
MLRNEAWGEVTANGVGYANKYGKLIYMLSEAQRVDEIVRLLDS